MKKNVCKKIAICLIFASSLIYASDVFANGSRTNKDDCYREGTWIDPSVLTSSTAPPETRRNWVLAREYQDDGRFELARQHLLLALASCNRAIQRDAIQRQLQIVELQIRTMR